MFDLVSRPVDQLGYVVDDLDAAIKGWLAQGVGPWLTLEQVAVADYRYRERASTPTVDVAFSQVGGLQLEVIQPSNNQLSTYRDFLAAGRRGIHHVGWLVEDYAGTMTAAKGAEQTVLQTGSWSGVHFAYIELRPAIGTLANLMMFGEASARKTDAVRRSVATFDGAIGEVIEVTGTSAAIFAVVKRSAAEWDGRSDPVRSLLSPAVRALFRVQSTVEELLRTIRGGA